MIKWLPTGGSEREGGSLLAFPRLLGPRCVGSQPGSVFDQPGVGFGCLLAFPRLFGSRCLGSQPGTILDQSIFIVKVYGFKRIVNGCVLAFPRLFGSRCFGSQPGSCFRGLGVHLAAKPHRVLASCEEGITRDHHLGVTGVPRSKETAPH